MYESLRPYRVEYTGVDYSDARIKMAQSTYSDLALVCDDLYAFLGHPDTEFDVITCFEVLEHLEEPEQALELARQCLSSEGFIIGSVPIDMPYTAHLQIFTDMADVQKRLNPIRCVAEHGHFWCKWESAHI